MPTSHGSLLGVDGVAKWVSGNTYAVDRKVWSPVNRLVYVRLIAGSGSTDPSADSTNWALFGPSRIKSVQRGQLGMSGSSMGAYATITAVDPNKTELRLLGVASDNGVGAGASEVYLRLVSSTQIELARVVGATISLSASWELTEWW